MKYVIPTYIGIEPGKVFKFHSSLELETVCVYPDERVGQPCILTVHGTKAAMRTSIRRSRTARCGMTRAGPVDGQPGHPGAEPLQKPAGLGDGWALDLRCDEVGV